MVWRRAGTTDQGIGVFLQVMGAPGGYNLTNLFIEGGLNWKAPFEGRDSDVFDWHIHWGTVPLRGGSAPTSPWSSSPSGLAVPEQRNRCRGDLFVPGDAVVDTAT